MRLYIRHATGYNFIRYFVESEYTMQPETAQILKNARRLHFVGIGGSGMFPVVQIMKSLGYEITGSDVNETDIVNYERGMGIPVNIPHEASAANGADAVIVTAALLPNNPEVQRAKELSIPIIKRAEMLGYITSLHDDSYCISGTHGKTTTTSMLTQIFYMANMDPAAVIGGKLDLIGGYGRSGNGKLMTCEACEYVDTFLQLHPSTAVILNIDRDHLEYFKTVENLIASFTKFANLAANSVVANADDANTQTALRGTDKKIYWFGESEKSDFLIKNIANRDGAYYDFTLVWDGKSLDISLNAPGLHNVHNAAAAATCAILEGVEPTQIASALECFHGAGRRFEILGKPRGITVADDYAHHPLELEVTLKAARQMGFGRIIAVFQPFTFSRTKMLLTDFADALSIADEVVLTEIMGSREVNTEGIYSSNLADLIEHATSFATFEEVADYAAKAAQPGDLIITLGCGDVYKVARMIIKDLG